MLHILKFSQLQWLEPYIEFNTNKKNSSRKKNGDSDGEALYKLMNNATYRKTVENLSSIIDLKLVNNEKDYLKWTSKPSYICRTKYFTII